MGALSIRREYPSFGPRDAAHLRIAEGIILAIPVAIGGCPQASIVRPSRYFCTSLHLARIHR
jgi:hypothetical protein